MLRGLLGREKGNELAKSFARCPSPVALRSLYPLGHVDSTPTPGTSGFDTRSAGSGRQLVQEDLQRNSLGITYLLPAGAQEDDDATFQAPHAVGEGIEPPQIARVDGP